MRWLALAALAACASSKSAEQHAEVAAQARVVEHASEESKASGRTTAGPETITTTVEEWTPAALPVSPTDTKSAATEPPALLRRRTVTVDQRGPVDTSWMANASGTQGAESQTSLKAASEAHSASKVSYWPPWWLMLGGALAAAAGLWALRGKIAPLLGILGKLF